MAMPGHKNSARPGGGARTDPACKGCPALCCHDLVMPIPRPRTAAEIEEVRWKLLYDTVSVFVSGGQWHLQVKARCIYLTDDHLCSIYEKRPDRCRRHDPSDCERYGSYYDVRFSTPEELEAYLAREKRGGRRKGRARRL